MRRQSGGTCPAVGCASTDEDASIISVDTCSRAEEAHLADARSLLMVVVRMCVHGRVRGRVRVMALAGWGGSMYIAHADGVLADS